MSVPELIAWTAFGASTLSFFLACHAVSEAIRLRGRAEALKSRLDQWETLAGSNAQAIRDLEAAAAYEPVSEAYGGYGPKFTVRDAVKALAKHLGLRFTVEPGANVPASLVAAPLPKIGGLAAMYGPGGGGCSGGSGDVVQAALRVNDPPEQRAPELAGKSTAFAMQAVEAARQGKTVYLASIQGDVVVMPAAKAKRAAKRKAKR